MSIFRKKPVGENTKKAEAEAKVIEIVAHKEAKKEIVQKAKEANAQLTELLEQNGFTIKIYLAAGGPHPKSRKRNA